MSNAPMGNRVWRGCTGWPGSGATDTQVQLQFATREAAVAYASAHGLVLEIVPLGPKTLKLQAYADNFR